MHKALGPGLLEHVYEKCLRYELEINDYKVLQQLHVPINYDQITIESDLRVDLLVNDLVVVELKTVEQILPVHEAQLLTYMKLLKKPQGLLINFFTDNISNSMKPFVNAYYKILPD